MLGHGKRTNAINLRVEFMLHEKIHLNKLYKIEHDPILEIMVPSIDDQYFHKTSAGILIIPGGGYDMNSKREGDPVALSFMLKGYCTFILNYTCKVSYPTPMIEVACAIDYLRKNASKYYLKKDELVLCGFSAGGHLASSYGYLCRHDDFTKRVDFLAENLIPNALILSYPVITMGKETHLGTKNNITNNGNKELCNLLSVEKHITKEYPPTFIWTTTEDTIVPYCNSKMLVEELNNNGVPNKFITYPFLDHGKSIGTSLVNDFNIEQSEQHKEISTWIDKADSFLKEILKTN